MTSKQSARDALATAALKRMFADEADAFDEFVANHKRLGLDYLTDCADNMCRIARKQADDVLAVLEGAEYEVVAAETVAANGAAGAALVDQAAEAARRGIENSVTLYDHYSATISLRIAEIQPQYGLVQLNASRKASDELVSCDVKRDAFLAAVEQVLGVKVIDAVPAASANEWARLDGANADEDARAEGVQFGAHWGLLDAAAAQRALAAQSRTRDGQAEHEGIADWLDERAAEVKADQS